MADQAEYRLDVSADASKVWWVLGLGVVVAALVAWLIAPEANSQFASAALAVTFATTAAVAIERIIEGAWAFIGQNKQLGGWWPLNTVRAHIVAFETETNGLLAGPLAEAIGRLETARDALNPATSATAFEKFDDAVKIVERERQRLEAKVAKAASLAPGSPRFEVIEAAAADGFAAVDWVVANAGLARDQAAELAEMAATYSARCEQARDVVASFSDNPARKGASLLAGMILGLLAAGAMGVNLFHAIETGDDLTGRLTGDAGTLITGLVIGLGSSPTHELIKALERRRRDNGLPAIPGLPVEPTPGAGRASAPTSPAAMPVLALDGDTGFDVDEVVGRMRLLTTNVMPSNARAAGEERASAPLAPLVRPSQMRLSTIRATD